MFGLEVVLYLCLGGLGGGLSAVAGIAGLSIPRPFMKDGLPSQYVSLLRSAFAAAAASLVLGSLLLLADSGNFSALPHLFFAPSLGYLSVGAWLIVITVGLCAVSALVWRVGVTDHNVAASRVLHAACALAGLAVALYTGLFLASMEAVPLWSTPWLPLLFILSSVSCGIVVFTALIKINDKTATFPSYTRMLAQADILIVALESLCAAALVLGLVMAPATGSSAVAGAASALDLVVGGHAWIWWGGFVGFGLIMTALLDALVIRAESNWPGRIWSTLGVSFCVLAGAFSLRYGFVMAGAHPALGF